ncbi:MAG: glycoside hydrolase family 71/99-like protein [Flavobacteriaceae bacterium]
MNRILSILFLVVLMISCSEESIESDAHVAVEKDMLDSLRVREGHFSIPRDSETYPDVELKSVLAEELEKIENRNFEKEPNLRMVVNKGNRKKVMVHYMPWFLSKEYDGHWGQHWTMANRNPDEVDGNGNAQIASYYHPIIGPYSSRDPHLQEYHFLLMKLAGVDGVIFDWYGSYDQHDYANIKEATETFMAMLDDIGLEFSIMYEDQILNPNNVTDREEALDRALTDFEYIKDTYLNRTNYQKENDRYIISVFGPSVLQDSGTWETIYGVFPDDKKPLLISLWGAKSNFGQKVAGGEFLWVNHEHLFSHEYYYNNYPLDHELTIGSSYPGFKSFYQEGGWSHGSNEWSIPINEGQTFFETLHYTHHEEEADFIQIITWNDFGEGTMIEPTTEFGTAFLKILQDYTKVSVDERDFHTAMRLYKARKDYLGNKRVQALLDNSYRYLKRLNVKRVDRIIAAVYRFYPK